MPTSLITCDHSSSDYIIPITHHSQHSTTLTVSALKQFSLSEMCKLCHHSSEAQIAAKSVQPVVKKLMYENYVTYTHQSDHTGYQYSAICNASIHYHLQATKFPDSVTS